jgi:hypothetical protein
MLPPRPVLSQHTLDAIAQIELADPDRHQHTPPPTEPPEYGTDAWRQLDDDDPAQARRRVRRRRPLVRTARLPVRRRSPRRPVRMGRPPHLQRVGRHRSASSPASGANPAPATKNSSSCAPNPADSPTRGATTAANTSAARSPGSQHGRPPRDHQQPRRRLHATPPPTHHHQPQCTAPSTTTSTSPTTSGSNAPTSPSSPPPPTHTSPHPTPSSTPSSPAPQPSPADQPHRRRPRQKHRSTTSPPSSHPSGVGKTVATGVAERLLPAPDATDDSTPPPSTASASAPAKASPRPTWATPNNPTPTGKAARSPSANRSGGACTSKSTKGEVLTKLMHERQGSTLGVALRTAWSGKPLGQANATAERTRRVTKYSMGLAIGFQPHAAPLIREAPLGTPQRFTYAIAKPQHVPGGNNAPNGHPPPSNPRNWGQPMAHACDEPVRHEVYQERVTRSLGLAVVDQLDTHEPLMLMKLAALLAILDDGRQRVTEDDWHLAKTIWDHQPPSPHLGHRQLDHERDAEETRVKPKPAAARSSSSATPSTTTPSTGSDVAWPPSRRRPPAPSPPLSSTGEQPTATAACSTRRSSTRSTTAGSTSSHPSTRTANRRTPTAR